MPSREGAGTAVGVVSRQDRSAVGWRERETRRTIASIDPSRPKGVDACLHFRFHCGPPFHDVAAGSYSGASAL